jgi:protein-tyrosine-phosphatase
MPTILMVGGADTGRAPMAAAVLRRLLEERGYRWAVESAGVLGHDGDAAEVEARDAMAHMGIDIADHRARSLTDELVAGAALLLALDSGTAQVVRMRYTAAADRVHALGALAGRQRDIPDPFRMQIGAWITYAREIAALLEAALPGIAAALLETALPRIAAALPPLAADDRALAVEEPSGGQLSIARAAAAERIERLLQTAAEMPRVVDWAAARAHIEDDLKQIAAAPRDATDLVAAYVGLLRAALAMTPSASPGQLVALRKAAEQLGGAVGQAQLDDLSARLGGWAAL